MKINLKKLAKLNACQEGIDWYAEHGSPDLLTTLLKVNEEHPVWARWLFTRLLTRKQNITIAIFAARQVLPIFEKAYPEDTRPRDAIKAAMRVLRADTAANRNDARVAAARIAADTADTADTADHAVHAAAAASYAVIAAYAANAANAAANAAAAAVAAVAAYADTDGNTMQVKLIRKAVKMLNEESDEKAI